MRHHQPETPASPKTPLQRKRSRRKSTARAWAIAFFLVAISVIGLLNSGYTVRGLTRMIFEPDRAFDSELWQAQDDNGTNYSIPTRESMIDDLLESEVLIGLTRSEVEELLGPAMAGLDAERWFYYVGSAVIDSVVLEVTFGEAGLVTAARTFAS